MSLTGRTTEQMEGSIQHGEYWPALALADFVAQYRPPVEHKQELIKNEILVATIAAQTQLDLFLTQFPTLSDASDRYPSMIETGIKALYQRAVFALARARLGKHFVTLGAKESQDTQADVDDNQYDYWLGQSKAAIGLLLGLVDQSALPAGYVVEAI